MSSQKVIPQSDDPWASLSKPKDDPIKSSEKSNINDMIKLNPTMFAKIDSDGTPTSIEDIYSLAISWCNDQASMPTPSDQEETYLNYRSQVNIDKMLDPMSKIAVIPNYKKGTIEFHYDLTDFNGETYDCNFVEFCIDSETFYNHLLNSEGDSTSHTNPFYANVCKLLLRRNVARLAAILFLYNVIIEVTKGNMSNENAAGYYGNAVGGSLIALIYGWGYYIYQGTIYKSTLSEGDKNRKDRIKLIKTKLERAIGSVDSKLNNDVDEDDIKYLLEEAIELGVSSMVSDPVVEQALRYKFHKIKEFETKTSTCPDVRDYFFNKEAESKLAAKVGFYEILDIAGKYLGQQRLYCKLNRSRSLEVFLVFYFLGDLFIVIYTGLIPYLTNFASCSKDGQPLETSFNCNAAGSGVVFAGLIYGALICHTLVDSFLRRYKILRKLKVPEFSDSNTMEAVNGDQLEFIKTFSLYLKRDCFERYILIKTIMDKISTLWGPLLVAILLISTIFLIYLYVILLSTNFTLYGTIAMFLFAVAINLTPILCCSYANSAMDKLYFSLKTSGPDDYSVIGGRDNFIEYATNTPCYWYIFGFAVTPSWLAGFVGGSVSAIAASILVTKFSE